VLVIRVEWSPPGEGYGSTGGYDAWSFRFNRRWGDGFATKTFSCSRYSGSGLWGKGDLR
jgi:hypothetical protein